MLRRKIESCCNLQNLQIFYIFFSLALNIFSTNDNKYKDPI